MPKECQITKSKDVQHFNTWKVTLCVIPAQAGIQKDFKRSWIPASAGMTSPAHNVFSTF